MPTDSPAGREIAEELFLLFNGFGILALPLFPLALPAAAMAAALVLPLIVLAVLGTLLVAAPALVMRVLLHRGGPR